MEGIGMRTGLILAGAGVAVIVPVASALCPIPRPNCEPEKAWTAFQDFADAMSTRDRPPGAIGPTALVNTTNGASGTLTSGSFQNLRLSP